MTATIRLTGAGKVFCVSTLGLLAGCGSGSSGSSGPGAGTPVLAYGETGFVYLTGVVAPPLAPLSQPAGVDQYTVAPALPAGLVLDATTGTIAGQPSAAAPSTVYTVTATGAGEPLQFSLELEVRASFGAPRFAYTLDWDNSRIQTWRVDGQTGQLFPGDTSVTDAFPFRAKPDPLGRFLFVTHFGTGNLGVYRIDAETGALTLAQLLSVGSAAFELLVSPDGRFLYVADLGVDVVAAFAIDPLSGLLTPNPQLLAIGDPSGLAISQDGLTLYVASLSGDLVGAFELDPVHGGIVSSRGSVATPGPFGLALTPDETGLFTANFGADAVTAIAIDPGTGQLTRIDSYFSGQEPVAITVDPSGARLAVASFGGERVESFAIAGDNSLSPIETIELDGAATNLVDLGIGGSLVAPLYDLGLLAATLPDTTPGSLRAGPRNLTSGFPIDFVPVRTSRSASLVPDHVYSANTTSGTVASFGFGPAAQLLDAVGQPLATFGKPSGLDLDRDGEVLYVADQLAEQVLGFERNAASGTLSSTTIDGFAGVLTRAVVVSPTTDRLFAIGNEGLSNFAVGNGGALTKVETVAAGLAPNDVVVSQNGRFVYVANRNSGDVSAYRLQGANLVEIQGSPFDNGLTSSPRSMALSPDGQLLAVASADLNEVRVHAIDGETGALTTIQDLGVGIEPRDLCWSLDGRVLYVAQFGDNSVAVLDRSGNDTLTVRNSILAGLGTIAVHLDESGERLIAAGFQSNSLEVFAVAADGGLAVLDSTSAGPGAGVSGLESKGRWQDL
jgi:6-phosphogluconolactonase